MITGAIITNIVIKKSGGQQSIALQTNYDYMLSFQDQTVVGSVIS